MDTFEWLKFGFQVLQFLLLGGIGIYVYLTNRDKATNSRLDAQVERIARLEAKSEAAVTHADLGDIHEKINDVAANLAEISGQMKGVSENLRLILARFAGGHE